jgi:hypothetical protein
MMKNLSLTLHKRSILKSKKELELVYRERSTRVVISTWGSIVTSILTIHTEDIGSMFLTLM